MLNSEKLLEDNFFIANGFFSYLNSEMQEFFERLFLPRKNSVV